MNIDYFTEGPVDPRIYNEMATDIWRLAVSYLPIRDVLKLPNLCKYFNEEIVWHKHSGRLLWGEMAPGTLDELVYEWRPGDASVRITVLMQACERCAPLAHISTLLAGRPNVNAADRYGRTALHLVCYKGLKDIACKLLEANADPNIVTNYVWTPLIMASDRGYAPLVSALIGYGAHINRADTGSKTALMRACESGRVNVVRTLVDARADVNMTTKTGQTAIELTEHEPIKAILRFADNEKGFTPLMRRVVQI